MSGRDGSPAGRREVAYRLFAAEYDDADLEYSDSEEERAPNYVITPTGARVNRLFVVGVLTEVESVSEDVLRARVVDPTGAFVVYAGQYQPDAVAFLETADVPGFVAVTGKARTFQPEGSDRVFTSVRPESVTSVDAPTRDRWTVQAAEHTLARIATMARAIDREERGDELAAVLRSAGVDPGLASGVAVGLDHYRTTKAYLTAVRDLATAAVEVVAGDRESVPALEIPPGGDGPVADDLAVAPTVAGTLTVPGDAEPLDTPRAGAETPIATEPAADVGTTDPGEPEPDPEPAAAEAAPAPGTATESGEATADDPEGLGGDDGPGPSPGDDVEAFDLDEAEREQVEAEFGTEFSTGSEVGAPGEAGIDTETEPPATDAPADGDDGPAAEPSTGDGEPPAADDASAGEAADAGAAIDLEDATVAAMDELDEGDGADRSAVVEAVAADHGVDPEAVESAIQEALMSGRCYEPSDGRLKAI